MGQLTNTGGTFNVTGFSTGSTSTNNTFTGGTVTGATQFTNGITANTISATTYFNLPTDRVTGGTYTNGTLYSVIILVEHLTCGLVLVEHLLIIHLQVCNWCYTIY
jgi:hypothetical protein